MEAVKFKEKGRALLNVLSFLSSLAFAGANIMLLFVKPVKILSKTSVQYCYTKRKKVT